MDPRESAEFPTSVKDVGSSSFLVTMGRCQARVVYTPLKMPMTFEVFWNGVEGVIRGASMKEGAG